MKRLVCSCLAVGLLLAMFLSAATLSACSDGTPQTKVQGSGNLTTEDRPVAGISGVALRTLGDLTIELGDQESLRLEGDDNLLNYLTTTMRGGILTIDQDPGVTLAPKKPIHYYLIVKQLESIELSSTGNITAPALTAPRFVVELRSTGDIALSGLRAESLDVRLSSTGNITLGTGQVGSQSISLSSSGDSDSSDIRSTSAAVDLSSSGNATIWVTDQLKADLTSSGDLRYYGSPVVNVNTSSSGDAAALGVK